MIEFLANLSPGDALELGVWLAVIIGFFWITILYVIEVRAYSWIIDNRVALQRAFGRVGAELYFGEPSESVSTQAHMDFIYASPSAVMTKFGARAIGSKSTKTVHPSSIKPLLYDVLHHNGVSITTVVSAVELHGTPSAYPLQRL